MDKIRNQGELTKENAQEQRILPDHFQIQEKLDLQVKPNRINQDKNSEVYPESAA